MNAAHQLLRTLFVSSTPSPKPHLAPWSFCCVLCWRRCNRCWAPSLRLQRRSHSQAVAGCEANVPVVLGSAGLCCDEARCLSCGNPAGQGAGPLAALKLGCGSAPAGTRGCAWLEGAAWPERLLCGHGISTCAARRQRVISVLCGLERCAQLWHRCMAHAQQRDSHEITTRLVMVQAWLKTAAMDL